MNITPNYQLKSFNSRVNNRQLQTNPSFGMKQYVTPAVTVLTGTAATALAAQVLAKPNLDKAEKTEQTNAVPQTEAKQEIPTREEFEKMAEKRDFPESWMEAFDKSPENTIKMYNLKDKDGNVYDSWPQTDDNDELRKYWEHPDLMKIIVDTEDNIGERPFSFPHAESILNISADYPNGLKQMLNLRKEDGSFRFLNIDDYDASEVFEKYPDMALKYAEAKDDIGNYRFSGEAIEDIVKAKTEGKYLPEKVDEFLNLKRPDGSYIFNEFRESDMDDYIREPKAFIELCNMRIVDSDKYLRSREIGEVLNSYLNFPQETKQILQNMPRFSSYEVKYNNAAYFLNLAPKSFQTLARITNSNKFAFSVKNIGEIIKKYKLDILEKENPDKAREIWKMFNVLAKVKYKDYNYWRDLNSEQIMKAAEVYPKYPKETIEIIQNRTLGRYDNPIEVIPSEDDIKLYIENRAEYDKKYQEN